MIFGKPSARVDRVALAEELADIRIRHFTAADRVNSELGRKIAAKLADVQREVWIELFLAHYSNKQLSALSEFYGSKIGRSIVATDLEIEKEFQEELRARMDRISREVEATHRTSEGGSRLGGVLIAHGQDRQSDDHD